MLFLSSVGGPLIFFKCGISLLFWWFSSLSLLTYFWLLLLVHICFEISSSGCKFFVSFFSNLLTYLLQCWVRTTVGVQCMMAMNVCSCWSRTEVLATTEHSRPCRSTTSTTTQVKVCLKGNIILFVRLEQCFVREVVGLCFYSISLLVGKWWNWIFSENRAVTLCHYISFLSPKVKFNNSLICWRTT